MSLRFIVIAALVGVVVASFFLYHNRQQTSQQESSFLLQQTRLLEIRSDYRQGTILKSGKDLDFFLNLPDNGQLSFSFGIPDTDKDPLAEPYHFSVEEIGPRPTLLFSQELHPSTRKQDRVWQEVNIDVSRIRNKYIRFRFNASTGVATAYLSQIKLLNPVFEKEKYSILLITIDTLRRDHVSAYGYRRPTTPALDALAKTSAVFKNAYATAPMTVPSVTSLMSSTYFAQHQVPNNRSAFDGSLPTLAEVLRANGYTTAAFIGNAVLKPDRGLNRGFDVYNAHLPGAEINRRLPERDALRLTTAAVNWLQAHMRERFFLWLHYQDPHAPYNPPEPMTTIFDPPEPSGTLLPVVPYPGDPGGIPEYALLPGIFDPLVYIARYDAEIRYTDQNIAEVLKFLREKSLNDHTMIAVAADHGESLGENNRYFAHGHNVTADLSNVPLLLYVPRKPHQVYSHPVQTIDIAPTLLKLLSLRVPPSFAGKFLFQPEGARKIICEQPNIRWAVIHDRGRYIYERTGEESWAGDLAGGELTEDHGTIQDWIARSLSHGFVLAFSGGDFQHVRITSNGVFRRAYLFDGEPGDLIRFEDREIQTSLQAASPDVDYVFVEPAASATLTIEGTEIHDVSGRPLNATFSWSDVTSETRLPQADSLRGSGVTVLRIPGKSTTPLLLNPEEQEEMKSIGYIGQ